LTTALLAAVYGIFAAMSWGTGDFSGGLATRRGTIYQVIVVVQAVGLGVIVALTVALGEPVPTGQVLFLGALTGIAGAFGLALLYQALAVGRMGVVAPVTSIVAGVIPVLVGVGANGLPGGLTLVGFALALLAVWWISRADAVSHVQLGELALPVAAGVTIGVFSVLIAAATTTSLGWPLLMARVTSTLVLLLLAIALQKSWRPARAALPLVLLAGVLDASGNIFFALAAQIGRLDTAAVVSGLYPAFTALLAWGVLKERLTGRQWAGLVLAVTAVMLISV
jgi:drug/metabolite transporter (DMT)-like permease